MSFPTFRSVLSHKRPLLTVCVRWLATKPNVVRKKLDTNLVLQTLQPVNNSSRPLVVLFSWMNAKERHIAKYGNLYASEGFDVLSIRVGPLDVLRPQKAQGAVRKVLKILEEKEQRDKPLLIHGFSVGGYVCGEMLVQFEKEAPKYNDICRRIHGQIFDSPVDFGGVPRGIANILAENKIGRSIIESTISGYLKVFENVVTKHYLTSSAAFHANFLKLPSLMLYSRADPIGVDKDIEVVANKWIAQGNPVTTKCWENTPHVSHFHHHPDEYVEAILKFVKSVGLSGEELQREDTLNEQRMKRVSV
ncbi:hypothetical protein SNE40_001796 [Patella caerulea]|uniref:Uncharacterized protein n=1 Tax=Patella caerulea TaxID=87958 RepID=A0AAN8K6H8_PATCE